jgi:hypothetical protein
MILDFRFSILKINDYTLEISPETLAPASTCVAAETGRTGIGGAGWGSAPSGLRGR